LAPIALLPTALERSGPRSNTASAVKTASAWAALLVSALGGVAGDQIIDFEPVLDGSDAPFDCQFFLLHDRFL
jgi:hypothetical protein